MARAKVLLTHSWAYLMSDDPSGARRFMRESIRHYPGNTYGYFYYLLSFLGRRGAFRAVAKLKPLRD